MCRKGVTKNGPVCCGEEGGLQSRQDDLRETRAGARADHGKLLTVYPIDNAKQQEVFYQWRDRLKISDDSSFQYFSVM